MKTATLEDLLLVRYGEPKWLAVFDVGNGTGSKCRRRADALAMNMWPSRDVRLHGFELKVSRGDFTRELATPEKAKAFSRFCDHWWMVTAPGICKASELPDDWGLLEAKKKGDGFVLSVKKKAPRLTPEPMSRDLLASFVRRASLPPTGAVYRAKHNIS